MNVVDRLDRYIARRMAARRTPGLALALFDHEKTARASTYGVSNLETRASDPGRTRLPSITAG
jgi:hypothetical protein